MFHVAVGIPSGLLLRVFQDSSMKMKVYVVSLMLIQLAYLNIGSLAADEDPLVFVPLLIRNKEHTLPYFLKLFEELDYPKNRMVLW
jgi:hypothetical protein